MADTFEEKYFGVLQNIEFGLVSVYRDNPNLVDTGTMYVMDTLIKVYTGELQGRQVALPQFKSEELAVYDRVRTMCEWRLGRAELMDAKGHKSDADVEPITVEEIIACLKRIRKSIERWYKEGGRRGYYEFIRQFVK